MLLFNCRSLSIALLSAGLALSALAQDATPPAVPPADQPPPDKRVFDVLPNYRTANETAVYTPITAKQNSSSAVRIRSIIPWCFWQARSPASDS